MRKSHLTLGVSLLIVCLVSFFYDKQIVTFFATYRPPFLNYFIAWVTNIFTTLIILLIITSLFLWKERKRNWILPLWFSFLVSGVLSAALKWFVSRPRPFTILNLPLVEGVRYSFMTFNTSFPSFHAAASFAVIPILDREFPKLKWFWITFATLIAFSRLYIGVHYLSDIILGGFLGYFVGKFLVYLEEKHKIFKLLINKLASLWH